MLENQITQLRIKNYRSIADVTVDLAPLTVLVGKNGSGKSNFIDAMRFMYESSTEHDAQIRFDGRGGASILCYRGVINTVPAVIQLQFMMRDGRNQEKPSDYNYYLAISVLDYISNKHESSGEIDEYIFNFSKVHDFEYVRSFPTHILKQPQKILHDISLESDGSNLSQILLQVLENAKKKKSLIFSLSYMVENIIDIRVTPLGTGYLLTEICHKIEGKETWLELWQESDGILRMLSILVALYKEGKAPLAIEEPELFLHPHALGHLAEIIQETSLRRQVIITTQSPDLISRFSADELRIVEMVNGETKIGMLEDYQRQSIEEELFSGGDLLRIEGLHRRSEPVAA
jgi:predicted ATPase